MIYAGRILLLQEWLDKVAMTVLRSQPELLALAGYCSILLGQMEQGLKRLTDAESCLRKGPPYALLAQVLAHRSIGHRFRGAYEESIKDAEAALALLDKLKVLTGKQDRATKDRVVAQNLAREVVQDVDIHEYERLMALAYRSKGLGFCMQGNLSEGMIWQQRSLELYQQAGDVQNIATLSMEIAITHHNAGQKALAQPLYLYALEAWRERTI